VRFRDGYNGSSFMELLEIEYPHLSPKWDRLFAAAVGELPAVAHGTTVIGLRFAEGAMVAGDRLATMDYRVASREIEKVFATDDYSLMAHHEKIEGEPLELEGKANTLAHLIKQNLPAAMQGLVVVPIFAGYDRRRQVGRLWRYEVTGGRYEEKEYDSVGSGSLFARESLKKSFRPSASRDQALAMVLEALADAADEDRGTGGVDAQRGIYPRVKICTSGGIEEISDEQVAGIHQSIIDGRRRPVE
jgi:proteasome beta subunit